MPNTTPLGSLDFLGSIFDWFAEAPIFFTSVGVVSFFNLLWALVVILGATVAYVTYLTAQTEHHHKAHYKASVLEASTHDVSKKRSAAWHDVAILEADSILDELIEDLGYVGANLGERLKAVPKGSMKNLEAAWSAHKVRNRIAHDTAVASLDKRAAIDTIGTFERVFREFDYI